MKLFSLDAETFLIRKGNAAPKMVCMSTCYEGEQPKLFHAVFDREALLTELNKAFDDPNVHLVNMNIGFDWMVTSRWSLPIWQRILDLYKDGRVSDLAVRQKIISLAYNRFYEGQNYNLAEMSREYLNFEMEKGADSVRTHYSNLIDIPVCEWETKFITYALQDAMIPIEVFREQAIYARKYPEKLQVPLVDERDILTNEVNESRSAIVAHCLQAWGFRTHKGKLDILLPKLTKMVNANMRQLVVRDANNPDCTSIMDPIAVKFAVVAFRAFYERKDALAKGPKDLPKPSKNNPNPTWVEQYERKLKTAFSKVTDWAIYRPRTKDATKMEDFSKNTFVLHALIYAATKGKCSLSKTGQIATGHDEIKDIEDPIIECYTSFQSEKREVTSTIPKLYMGVKHPLPTRFNTLLATGRWSSSGMSLHTFSSLPGVRECVIPRPGTVFLNADYDSLEIRTWGHVCKELIGRSTAADNYNKDSNWDPHSLLGSKIMGTSYEDFFANKKDPVYKNTRDSGKPLTFGCPTGMGKKAIKSSAKGYGFKFTDEKVEELLAAWMRTYPEYKDYFKLIDYISRTHKMCVQVGSKRQRSDCSYTQVANSFFQGLAADLVKDVGWHIVYETFQKSSPLYGSRLINVIHDEFILEAPLHCYQEAGIRLVQIMKGQGGTWLSVPLEAEVVAMDEWSKKAYPVYNEKGELGIWTSKHLA